MADETIDRVVAEAALAERFKTEIDRRASVLNVPQLVTAVEAFDPLILPPDGDTSSTNELEIGLDTDGVPYLMTGV